MGKPKTTFVCQECGAVAPRWLGRCPECEGWNTLVEEPVLEEGPHVRGALADEAAPVPITEGLAEPPPRLLTGIGECDRVLGGGIVPGSLGLVGGDPGIGKSTLMLQLSHHLARTVGPVLYVSAEESFEQTRLRARRLDTLDDRLFLLTENSVGAVLRHVESQAFAFCVIDSIQSVYSPQLAAIPGSVGQVRECANEFMRLAKSTGVPVFLVGHVTKEGLIAGPRLLEHLVDTVLYFEGEGKQALRILRAVKNRFGSTNEIGVFEMRETGLHEVPNPSAWFLNERPENVSGSVVLPSIEGTRPLLVEVQALVGDYHAGSPRRAVMGINPNRLSLILAVLEKRAGLHFADRDVFVNVAGGVRLDEPAADAAIALALVSSFRGVPVAGDLAAFGEIGLAGEVRAVDMARRRLAEAGKFGFKRCIVPRNCMADLASGPAAALPVANVTEVIDAALES
ncbi:MAG TPA: DNA repair protein RadA [Candidatus Hydrogenedentes bacterium]|nr:DNA repair protein RadA [Candidatus Hydrogenedentota bacterium]